MDISESVLRLLMDKSDVTQFIGTFISWNGSVATIDAGGGRFPAKTATPYRPQVGETVWIFFIDEVPFMMGPTLLKPGTATVVSVTSGLATVTTDIGSVVATYNSGVTLSAGQAVKLMWGDGPHIIGVLSAVLPVPTAPAQPNPSTPVVHSDTFTAVDAGSWNGTSGWWSPEVLADDADLGAWFYGSKIADTIRGGQILRVELFASLKSRSGAAPNIGYHAHPARPAGTPTITAAAATDVADGQWVALPISVGTFLASNAGGIGVAHGGATTFRSLTDDAQSGALRITSTY